MRHKIRCQEDQQIGLLMRRMERQTSFDRSRARRVFDKIRRAVRDGVWLHVENRIYRHFRGRLVYKAPSLENSSSNSPSAF